MRSVAQVLKEIIKIHTGHMASNEKPSDASEKQEMDLLQEAYMLVTGEKANMGKKSMGKIEFEIV